MRIKPNTRMVVLTGAGISAESGIMTFRDSGGLWENKRVEDVATPEAFERDPRMVWEFYLQRFQQAAKASPNPAHYALVELEKFLGDNFAMITQNIDGLHARAGSARMIEMHGSLQNCICVSCAAKHPMPDTVSNSTLPTCTKCGALLRPDIVWFGEMPYRLNEIQTLLRNCDVFILVGTSGVVYPAAGFVQTAKFLGAQTIAINKQRTANSQFIDRFYEGKAGEILPRLVSDWIGTSPA